MRTGYGFMAVYENQRDDDWDHFVRWAENQPCEVTYEDWLAWLNEREAA